MNPSETPTRSAACEKKKGAPEKVRIILLEKEGIEGGRVEKVDPRNLVTIPQKARPSLLTTKFELEESI